MCPDAPGRVLAFHSLARKLSAAQQADLPEGSLGRSRCASSGGYCPSVGVSHALRSASCSACTYAVVSGRCTYAVVSGRCTYAVVSGCWACTLERRIRSCTHRTEGPMVEQASGCGAVESGAARCVLHSLSAACHGAARCCGCLYLQENQVLKYCLLRLDSAIFNAPPAKPLADPVTEPAALPFTATGKLTYSHGMHLKYAVNVSMGDHVSLTSAWATMLHNLDAHMHAQIDCRLASSHPCCGGSSGSGSGSDGGPGECFPKLRAMAQVLPLPKDLLADQERGVWRSDSGIATAHSPHLRSGRTPMHPTPSPPPCCSSSTARWVTARMAQMGHSTHSPDGDGDAGDLSIDLSIDRWLVSRLVVDSPAFLQEERPLPHPIPFSLIPSPSAYTISFPIGFPISFPHQFPPSVSPISFPSVSPISLPHQCPLRVPSDGSHLTAVGVTSGALLLAAKRNPPCIPTVHE
ncbi:unnamed protein product [Closterium sp. NIES-65]|nr:unnamed protein product [Closterium sp. NIES-65]